MDLLHGVEITVASLDPPAARVAELDRLLAADERARAGRFRFPRHQRRFAVGRGILRNVLASHLGRPAAGLRFVYGEHGKPALDGEPALAFNLAHSHELIVVAVGRNLRLGVDVERLRTMSDREALARRFFAPAETAALEALPESERDDAFLRCWTRKEALLKARGDGLTVPLDRFAVSLDEPARLLFDADRPGAAERWQLGSLRPAPGYVGALAVGPAADRDLRGPKRAQRA